MSGGEEEIIESDRTLREELQLAVAASVPDRARRGLFPPRCVTRD